PFFRSQRTASGTLRLRVLTFSYLSRGDSRRTGRRWWRPCGKEIAMTTFDPFRDLEHFANAFFDSGRRGPRQMPMDLYRIGDRYILSADLPGIDPGSVDIDVDGQLLTIRAERTLTTEENATWIARERTGGSFLRQLTLGQ